MRSAVRGTCRPSPEHVNSWRDVAVVVMGEEKAEGRDIAQWLMAPLCGEHGTGTEGA